ncbi:MAG: rod shape-determining protein RodA [Bacteroidia bacterium]
MNRKSFDFDWISILLCGLLMLGGWMAIYAVSNTSDAALFTTNHGKQLIWVGVSAFVALVILSLDNRFIEAISYFVYGGSLLLLLSVFVLGRTVNGAHSWLVFGGISLQPTELAKVATAMALAKYMSSLNFNLNDREHFLTAVGIVLTPMLITLLQNDTGSALVFGSFLFVFYREGLTPLVPLVLLITIFVAVLTLWLNNQVLSISIFAGLTAISCYAFFSKKYWQRIVLIHGIAFVLIAVFSLSTNLIVNKVLQPHQRNRIMVLFNPNIDPQGLGYNSIQSKIAIGSGGLLGKGFLKGNYTKYKFVPKQVTDFIFCTVGEEGGWIGSAFLVLAFLVLILRAVYLGEHSKTKYARIYGYSVASILFFHVFVNIGMAIGLVPVIGIPLPFFSYGGSSLLSFTILIFLLINHFSYRSTILGAKY